MIGCMVERASYRTIFTVTRMSVFAMMTAVPPVRAGRATSLVSMHLVSYLPGLSLNVILGILFVERTTYTSPFGSSAFSML